MFITIDTNALIKWIKANQILLSILASAVIGTMPPVLPSFRTFPQWVWTWIHDAAKTFLNFKHTSNNTESGFALHNSDAKPKNQLVINE